MGAGVGRDEARGQRGFACSFSFLLAGGSCDNLRYLVSGGGGGFQPFPPWPIGPDTDRASFHLRQEDLYSMHKASSRQRGLSREKHCPSQARSPLSSEEPSRSSPQVYSGSRLLFLLSPGLHPNSSLRANRADPAQVLQPGLWTERTLAAPPLTPILSPPRLLVYKPNRLRSV